MSSEVFIPTYLYIKQHSITGKLYFGKTIKDPETYQGSGTHWVNHIKKHGRQNVVNLWYCLFLDAESINQFAISFSEQQNIVESDDWLNQIPENGLDVRTGVVLSEQTKSKISKAKTGKSISFSDSHKKNLSIAMRNKPKSESHREKLSLSKIGQSPSNKGKSAPQISCPHCDKVGDKGNMTRWHIPKCRQSQTLLPFVEM